MLLPEKKMKKSRIKQKIIRNVLVSVKDMQKYNEKESCSILAFHCATLETKTKMKKRKKNNTHQKRARF